MTIKTKIEANGYSFFIENIWLTETGIRPFSEVGGHYEYFKQDKDRRDIIILKISEINPSIRGCGIPIFRDQKSVLDILRAFKNRTPLPPVDVKKMKNGKYTFELKDGCHRLHLSIAVGFDSIPAVIAEPL